jgi:hypothetical protein
MFGASHRTASLTGTVGATGSAMAKKPAVNLFAAFEKAKEGGNISEYNPNLFKSMKDIREEKKAATAAIRSERAKRAAATRKARTNARKAAGGAGIPEENSDSRRNSDGAKDGFITLIQSWAAKKDAGYIERLLERLTMDRSYLDPYVTSAQAALLRDEAFFAYVKASLEGPDI